MRFSAFRRSARSFFSFATAGIARSGGRHGARRLRRASGVIHLSSERL